METLTINHSLPVINCYINLTQVCIGMVVPGTSRPALNFSFVFGGTLQICKVLWDGRLKLCQFFMLRRAGDIGGYTVLRVRASPSATVCWL
jgi:hypothetical protein